MDTTIDRNATYFVTGDGRRIDFIQDWFEQKKNWPQDSKNLGDFVKTCIDGHEYPSNPRFILNKIVTANTIIKLLSEYCYPFSPSASLLDVCTGPAVLPRIFKALNLAGTVHGIDIISRPTSSEEIWNVWREAARQATTSFHGNAVFDIFLAMNTTQTGLNNVFDVLLSPPHDGPIPEMDDYMVGDFLGQEYDSKFDLVTMMAGLDYFNNADFFEKISDVMNPGGYFVTFNDYFFELFGAAMHLPMDAPWMHAQMSKDDFIRYYSQHHPDIAELVDKAYFFADGHHHFTVLDYKRSAEEHGLEMLGYRRVINQDYVKLFLFGDPSMKRYFVDQILPGVRSMSAQATPEDLFTSYLTMVFRRK